MESSVKRLTVGNSRRREADARARYREICLKVGTGGFGQLDAEDLDDLERCQQLIGISPEHDVSGDARAIEKEIELSAALDLAKSNLEGALSEKELQRELSEAEQTIIDLMEKTLLPAKRAILAKFVAREQLKYQVHVAKENLRTVFDSRPHLKG